MKNSSLKRWEQSLDKLLNAVRAFGQVCDRPFDRGFIGELLALRQLFKTYGRRSSSIEYYGSSAKEHDIKVRLGKKTIKLNIKSTRTWDNRNQPRWVRQSANTFCDITILKSGVQRVQLKKDYDPSLFYIFVDVKKWLESDIADFYVLSDQKAKIVFGKKYRRFYNGKTRKSKSTADFWIEYTDIKNFKDDYFRSLFK
jgi:hypothetical protein